MCRHTLALPVPYIDTATAGLVVDGAAASETERLSDRTIVSLVKSPA